jgi:hypothetical protein
MTQTTFNDDSTTRSFVYSGKQQNIWRVTFPGRVNATPFPRRTCKSFRHASEYTNAQLCTHAAMPNSNIHSTNRSLSTAMEVTSHNNILGQLATTRFETLKQKRSASKKRQARKLEAFEAEIARMKKKLEEQQKKLDEKRKEKAQEEWKHSDANVTEVRHEPLYSSQENEEYVFLEAMRTFLESKEEDARLTLVDPRHVLNVSNKYEFNLVRVNAFENDEITFKNRAVQLHWLIIREDHPEISIRPRKTSYAVHRERDGYYSHGCADALNEAGESVNRIAPNTDPLYGSLDELHFHIRDVPSRRLVNQEAHVALFGAGAGGRKSPDCTVVVHWIELTRVKQL